MDGRHRGLCRYSRYFLTLARKAQAVGALYEVDQSCLLGWRCGYDVVGEVDPFFSITVFLAGRKDF